MTEPTPLVTILCAQCSRHAQVRLTASGYAYRHAGWPAVVTLGLMTLLLPLGIGCIAGWARAEHTPCKGHGWVESEG
jgi:hypothetical protein